MSKNLTTKQLLEKLKKIIIEPRPMSSVIFDDMEDETGLNIGECMTFAQMGEAPTPVATKKKETKKEKKNESIDIEEREVTPLDMMMEVEETFDPFEVLYTIVKNRRELIKVSVFYTNPDDKVLTHTIKCEFLDEITEDVIDETIDEDLTIGDALDQLRYIFTTHFSVDEFKESLQTHPRFISDYDYTQKDFEEGQRVDTIEGNGVIEHIGTTGQNIYYRVKLDNGNILDAYGWELLPENFKNVISKLTNIFEEINDSGKKGVLEQVAEWIDKLNFKNVKSRDGFHYMYKGNYEHHIDFNNGNLILNYRIYSMEKPRPIENKSWYVNDHEKVEAAFKVISKILDSYE